METRNIYAKLDAQFSEIRNLSVEKDLQFSEKRNNSLKIDVQVSETHTCFAKLEDQFSFQINSITIEIRRLGFGDPQYFFLNRHPVFGDTNRRPEPRPDLGIDNTE